MRPRRCAPPSRRPPARSAPMSLPWSIAWPRRVAASARPPPAFSFTAFSLLPGPDPSDLHRDASDRPTAILVDGAPAARITWSPEGLPVTVRMGDTEVHARRADDGRITGVLISAPMDRGRTTQWLEVEWDIMGRPTT